MFDRTCKFSITIKVKIGECKLIGDPLQHGCRLSNPGVIDNVSNVAPLEIVTRSSSRQERASALFADERQKLNAQINSLQNAPLDKTALFNIDNLQLIYF